MPDISVNTAHISDSASQIARTRKELLRDLRSLQSAANRLRTQWQGDAQQAFSAKYSSWASEAERLAAVLLQASRAGSEIAEIYNRTDARVAALWAI